MPNYDRLIKRAVINNQFYYLYERGGIIYVNWCLNEIPHTAGDIFTSLAAQIINYTGKYALEG